VPASGHPDDSEPGGRESPRRCLSRSLGAAPQSPLVHGEGRQPWPGPSWSGIVASGAMDLMGPRWAGSMNTSGARPLSFWTLVPRALRWDLCWSCRPSAAPRSGVICSLENASPESRDAEDRPKKRAPTRRLRSVFVKRLYIVIAIRC
jgi:hypothetical protein